MNELKGAGGIIYDKTNNKILIVQGNQGIYSLPKGHTRRNEEIIDCAIREINEETGIVLTKDYLSSCKSVIIYEYIFFIVSVDNAIDKWPSFNIIDKKEIKSCQWYDISDVLTFYHYCNQSLKRIMSNWVYYNNMM